MQAAEIQRSTQRRIKLIEAMLAAGVRATQGYRLFDLPEVTG